MTKTKTYLAPVLMAMLLASCASKGPVLVARDAVAPAGIDLSGSWIFRADPSVRRLPPQEEGIRIGREQGGRRQSESRSSKRRGSGMSAQVFIENGENLKLTQTEYGLFISYDRSVVEEFTFGENREVTIGPIEAQRVSGWDGNKFIAETRDAAGNILVETWALREKDILVRNLRILDRDKEKFEQQQIFDRK